MSTEAQAGQLGYSKLINLAIRRHETSLTYESLRIKVRSSVECVKIQVTQRVMWID